MESNWYRAAMAGYLTGVASIVATIPHKHIAETERQPSSQLTHLLDVESQMDDMRKLSPFTFSLYGDDAAYLTYEKSELVKQPRLLQEKKDYQLSQCHKKYGEVVKNVGLALTALCGIPILIRNRRRNNNRIKEAMNC